MRLLTIFLFTLIWQTTFAQNLKGKVLDADNGDLSNAVVALISKKDSSLISFARVSANGSYLLKKPANGSYVVFITHPKYADFIDTIEVTTAYQNIPDLKLQSKRKVLEAVIVKAQVAPIRMKGDTTIYTADSFKVKEGATVEDLFKKLPGFSVDSKGEIKAQGKTVQNLLVDGEEFFGNDPGMVAKTLSASAIDKVEVYEKKSDQAEFTGIDDGTRQQTVNLKLKANAKKGTTGKVELAGGTPENYDIRAMLQAFKGKRKLALFGLTGNIGNTDLGWEDREKYGDNDGMEVVMDGNSMMISQEGDEFNSFWGGQSGIPKNWNAGAHYNNKFNNDKQSINLSYRYNKINTIADSKSFSKTFLTDSSWNNNSGNNSVSNSERNKLSFTSETKLDSLNSLKVSLSFSEKDNNRYTNSFSEAFSGNTNINGNNRINNATGNEKQFKGNMLWRKKFKKLRRTLSLNVGTTINDQESIGQLFSDNRVFKGGLLFRADTVDQRKINENNTTIWQSKIAYTEPVGKNTTLEISYGFATSNSIKNLNSFDKSISGKYDVLAAAFSNNFLFKTSTHQPRIGFNYTKKKTVVNIGTQLSVNQFEQENKTTNTNRAYNFVQFLPTANIRFGLKKNKNLSFNYNGNGTAPTLDQLQPIQDNANPFSINIGNPNLKQSFNHSFGTNFSFWDMLTQKSAWSGANFNIVQNAIAYNTVLDSFGRSVSQAVNVNGNVNGYLYSNYNIKLKKLGIDFSVGPNANYNRNVNFINGQRNISSNIGYGGNIRLSDYKQDKKEELLYSWGITYDAKQNKSYSTINKTADIKYWSMELRVDGSVKLFSKTILELESSSEFRQKDPRFPRNNNFTLFNAEIKRSIIKDQWMAGFKVRDILNQNRGFNRGFYGNTFTESFYNTLQRYYLVTVTYKFNTQKAKAKSNGK